MEQTYVYSKIIKQEKQVDGTLLVTGIATDDSIDIDQQICDPAWLAKAMPEWFAWGNIREQHSNIAAGVATEYKSEGNQHIITARVVDPSSVKKVESGVLKGFSIGIRAPRVMRDNKAAGGRIIDGTIVEVSLVDRPANPTCLLNLAKSVDGEIKQVEELTEKAAEKMCDKCGEPMGMDDKSCKMCDGLMGEHKAAEESSQELGEESSQEPGEESSREGGVAGVAGLSAQATDVKETNLESEVTAPETEVEAPIEAPAEVVAETVADETAKAAEESSEESQDETTQESSMEPAVEESSSGDKKKKTDSEKLKAMSKRVKRMEKTMNALLSYYEASVTKSDSTEDIAKAVTEVAARVSKVEKSASRGPVRTAVQKTVVAPTENTSKAAAYRAKAAGTVDPTLAKGYLMLAAELDQNPTDL